MSAYLLVNGNAIENPVPSQDGFPCGRGCASCYSYCLAFRTSLINFLRLSAQESFSEIAQMASASFHYLRSEKLEQLPSGDLKRLSAKAAVVARDFGALVQGWTKTQMMVL